MDRRKVGFLLIGAGAIIAALVGFLVYQTAVEAEALRAAQPKTWAVVAIIDIPARTPILREQLDVVRVQEEAVPTTAAKFMPEPGATEGAVNQQKEVLLGRVIGQVAGTAIHRGEVISLDRVGEQAARTKPALQIPPGRVWYHFPAAVRGGNPPNDRILITHLDLVRAGDSVDIYYTTLEAAVPVETTNPTTEALRNLYTRRILQNVRVQNIGVFPPGAATPPAERFITFEVSPDEALRLKWLKDAATITGNIELIVRSPQDTQELPRTTINFDIMSSETGIGTGQ
jgi:Flp pilus assembly protein CpaB